MCSSDLGKTLQTAVLALVMASAVMTTAQAQEKVLRVAMTAADIPRTLGQPDQGFEGMSLHENVTI